MGLVAQLEGAQATARMQEIYAEPMKPELVTARIKEILGCGVILYGGPDLRTLKISARMGCEYLWYPRYNSRMGSTDDIGWSREQVVLWQYTDGKDNFTRYPTQVPGLGPTDMTVYMGDPADFPKKLLWSP